MTTYLRILALLAFVGSFIGFVLTMNTAARGVPEHLRAEVYLAHFASSVGWAIAASAVLTWMAAILAELRKLNALLTPRPPATPERAARVEPRID
jgi:short subunit dehydrogenase-like uncharacterized protein